MADTPGYILGISAFYHDSAAALIKDGVIIAASHEERFTRKKHDASFPLHAARFCLEETGITLHECAAVAFYDKPFLKFERLLETYYAFAPRGLYSFCAAMPRWIKEKLFLKRLIRVELQKIDPRAAKTVKLLFTEHHLSHAASAFYPSPFAQAAILTIDGVGEWATTSLCRGAGNEIEILKELHFPHSLGLLYSAFTYYLGFTVNSGEYKLMGLAPYGNPYSEQTKRFVKIIKERLIVVHPDGSLWLNQTYFDYAVGLTMARERLWEYLFGFPRRAPEVLFEQHHADLASAIQQVCEEAVLRMAQEVKRLTGAEYLCLAGGVALNCVANGALLRSGFFKDIWIQPAAGDAGGALGAALAAHYIYFGAERRDPAGRDAMQGAYLGPAYSDAAIEEVARRFRAPYERYDDTASFTRVAASVIAGGAVVGWFQGRMEWGPRALGNRSILGDPRNPEMQKRLNLKIKFREGFRPFAPSVLHEDAARYFDLDRASPYMLLTAPVREAERHVLPANYTALPIMERLHTVRSAIPAVTHVDFSARIQTVHRETNELYYELISAFKEKTGCGVLVNTSFNVRGEPMVCTPEDAYRCFMRTDMDYLVMGRYIFAKHAQPYIEDRGRWQETFMPD